MSASRLHLDKSDIWSALSAPLPPGVISWRQDGRPISRDGRHIARFVAYIEANTVRERLDAVVPGEWDLTLELLPSVVGLEEDANQGPCSFKGKLQILGVIREDVGTGKDYKQAATDAFKRAAVRFGIGHELYSFEQNWVQMDGEGKYARPIEDPAVAYARRHGRANGAGVKSATAGTGDTRPARRPEATPETPASQQGAPASSSRPVIDGQEGYGGVPERERGETASGTDEVSHTAGPLASDEQSCPKCGGRMWDNRLTKRNPKAPDYKCRDRSCDGVIWPPKPNRQQPDSGDEGGEPTEEIPF